MVTGRISFFSPLYSPISSSVRVVRASSSRRHCRPATVLVTRISVVALALRHRGRADQRLAGAAGQHDHAGAARPEHVRGLLLVVAQMPAGLVELDRVRLAVDVAGEVLGRPADLEQRLLEPAALGRVDEHRVVVDALAEHRRDLLLPQDLFEHRAVERDEDEAVDRVLGQLQPAVAVHRVGDVDEQRVRHGVARVPHERVDDLLGVVAGGARVPQPQRGEPVGVHVFRAAFELGERRDRGARLLGERVVDLEQAASCRTGRSAVRRSRFSRAVGDCPLSQTGVPARMFRRSVAAAGQHDTSRVRSRMALSHPSGWRSGKGQRGRGGLRWYWFEPGPPRVARVRFLVARSSNTASTKNATLAGRLCGR